MDEKQYLEQRLQDQIDWYERKSQSCQFSFKLLRSVELGAAAAIPFLSGYTDKSPYLPLVVACLGLAIAVITGLLSLYQFQERWVEYRSTAELLKGEKFLFLARIEPYAGTQAFPVLVQRVEGFLAKEISGWAQYSANAGRTPKANDGEAA